MQSKLLSMNIHHRNLLAAISLLMLSACASESADLRDDEPDMTNVRCANGEPLACVEKMGKTISCTCQGRHDLERMTKKGIRHW